MTFAVLDDADHERHFSPHRLAGAKASTSGNLQVGDMIAFITYTMLIVMSFLMLTMISIMLPRAGVAAARIDEIIQTEVEVTDRSRVRDEELSPYHRKDRL